MNQKKAGFTIIELLIVLGISATLMGIIGVNFAKERQKGDLRRASQKIGQDIRFARSKALAQSTSWRINFTANNAYVVEEWNPDTNSWVTVRTRTMPGSSHLDSGTVTGMITFDSRGFADIAPANLDISIENDNSEQEIIISMTGSLVVMDIENN